MIFHRRFFRCAPRVLALFSGAIFCAHSASAQFANPRDSIVFRGRKVAAPTREELQKQLDDARVLATKNARNAALQRFKIEQAQIVLSELSQFRYSDEDEARRFAAQLIARATTVAKSDGDAASLDVLRYVFAPDSLTAQSSQSALHERAYWADNDGSAQPFWVFLPRDYSPAKKYPLAISLHGYNPAISKLRAPIPGEDVWGEANRRGFIVAVPYGRRNTDFLGVGADDVLRVLAETKSLYSIDDDRVFLMGASMGGFGTLAVGLQHPDVFAGLAPTAARTDIYRWLRLSRAALPDWKRFLNEANDPRSLEDNALNLPILMQHGALDNIVPVEHSRLFIADLRAKKYDVSYLEAPSYSHELGADSIVRTFDWTRNRKRNSAPRNIVFTTSSLSNARAYWARITAFREYSRAAKIEIHITPDGAIEAKTDNVAAFTLTPPRALFPDVRRITLRVNGIQSGLHDATQPIVWKAPIASTRVAPDAQVETPALSEAAAPRDLSTTRDAAPQNEIVLPDPPAKNRAEETAVGRNDVNAANAHPPGAAPKSEIVFSDDKAANAGAANGNRDAEKSTLQANAAKKEGAANGNRDAEKPATNVVETAAASTRANFPGVKTPELCGPIRAAYRAPFLLVFGTRGAANVPAARDDAAREYAPNPPTASNAATRSVAPDYGTHGDAQLVLMTRDEANARRFLREWRDYADGTPPIKSDTQIAPDDEKNFNLILFGDSASNAVLARIGAQLPLELTPDGYRIGARQIKTRDIGLQFCYPSPLAKNRLVVVQSGNFYGDALPVNHKFDLLPDFLVFTSTFDPRDGTNDALEAGFFDGDWQLPNAAP